MTALGAVALWRAYFACRACGTGGYSADRLLGLDGFLTRRATRLICLLGGQNSFAVAARLLAECCGWKVSDETIRRACQAEAPRIAAFGASSPAVAEAFAAAAGDVEFQVDAAKVDTTGGWRDMKVGIFARRERGEPATPAEWDTRDLPAPTTRAAFAAIEAIDDFAPRWGAWAARLGLKDLTAITVLGDGAEWIWNAASRQFGASHQVLDIYHAAEYVADASKGLFGEGTPEAASWLERGRGLLLSDGWAGLCDHIGATLEAAPELAGHAALGTLTGYLAAHTTRLNYCHRLYTGRSIGSGMVEGAAKNLVGRRLKQTGARWEVENVNRMAELCCLTYSDHWDLYWASPN
jgi:TorA maturation chaperone TorD